MGWRAAMHGVDRDGRIVRRKVLRRDQVPVWSAVLPRCELAQEAPRWGALIDGHAN
jgi:hypothetical protein